MITVTDNDLDTSTDSEAYLDLGGNLQITDDGPSAGSGTEVTSAVVLETADAALVDGGAGSLTDSTSYQTAFESAISVPGAYGADSTNPSAEVSADQFTLDLQVADGDPALGYVQVDGAEASAAQVLTSGNAEVYLYQLNDATVVASTLNEFDWGVADQSDPVSGAYVFTVTTTSEGLVTLQQYAEIDHLPSDYATGDYANQSWYLADGQINLCLLYTSPSPRD